MGWNGEKIRERASEINRSIVALSRSVGVSRQTIDAWIKGQIPRGQHLIKLCSDLGVAPEYFFAPEKEPLVSVPQHRTIGKKTVTTEMQRATKEVAEDYINLFRAAPASSIVRVIRATKRDRENAKKLGAQLRQLSGISDDHPMDFEHAFKMLSELGIYVVFRPFPDTIRKKVYAFYSTICRQRVIFVNTDTNIIDLIFQLIHEAIHAVRDEEPDKFDEREEEDFCDLVASYIQFPDSYVTTVAQAVRGCSPGLAINKLKAFAQRHKHSLFGIMTRLKENGIDLEKMGIQSGSLVGADTNLKKTVHTVSNVLFANSDVRTYIDKVRSLSPEFINLVAAQSSQSSLRKLGEWLGFDSSLDAKSALSELQRIKVHS